MVKTEIQSVKLRFGIIGNTEGLNRAIDIAMQVASYRPFRIGDGRERCW